MQATIHSHSRSIPFMTLSLMSKRSCQTALYKACQSLQGAVRDTNCFQLFPALNGEIAVYRESPVAGDALDAAACHTISNHRQYVNVRRSKIQLDWLGSYLLLNGPSNLFKIEATLINYG